MANCQSGSHGYFESPPTIGLPRESSESNSLNEGSVGQATLWSKPAQAFDVGHEIGINRPQVPGEGHGDLGGDRAALAFDRNEGTIPGYPGADIVAVMNPARMLTISSIMTIFGSRGAPERRGLCGTKRRA